MSNLYIEQNGKTVAVEPIEYKDEGALQKLIGNNPGLVARDDSEELKLVSSEWPTGSGPIDHLMLDVFQGILVLVEDKLSRNGEIRRKVMGQINDYACKVSGWDLEMIKSCFYENNPDAKKYTKEFWNLVKDNMVNERIRLAFVADTIPVQLREMISFNQRHCTESIEWYAVEVNRHRIKVPGQKDPLIFVSKQIIGDVKEKKSSSSKALQSRWDEQQTLDRIANEFSIDQCEISRKILKDLPEMGYQIEYGRGEKQIRISFILMGKSVVQLSVLKKGIVLMPATKDFASICKNTYTQKEIETMFTDLPIKDENYDKDCYVKPTAVSIKVSQLEDIENYSYILGVLKELYEKCSSK